VQQGAVDLDPNEIGGLGDSKKWGKYGGNVMIYFSDSINHVVFTYGHRVYP
jgi:hypothetical protein